LTTSVLQQKKPGASLLAVVPQKRPAEDDDSTLEEHYYNCLWRKMTTKKHKTWDGDGVIVVLGKSYTLKDSEGKEIGKASSGSWGKLQSGETISIGGKDVEVVSELDPAAYKSGRVFISSVEKSSPAKVAQAPRVVMAYKNPAKGMDTSHNNTVAVVEGAFDLGQTIPLLPFRSSCPFAPFPSQPNRDTTPSHQTPSSCPALPPHTAQPTTPSDSP
jgi:hypothetical protein